MPVRDASSIYTKIRSNTDASDAYDAGDEQAIITALRAERIAAFGTEETIEELRAVKRWYDKLNVSPRR